MSVDVNAAAIPEELKELDKWLVWDTSKEEKRPFSWNHSPTALYGGSKHDPDDHLTFEEALEAAEASDTVGIGLAFDENDPYVGFDFDGCYNEDGRAADWIPSLRLFKDAAYVERSPSGEGLHAWVRDTDIPDWWSNIEDEGEEHLGVEVYDKWFFTVTGDSLDALGSDEIGAVDGVEAFLRQCHKSLKGEDPFNTKTSASDHGSGNTTANGDEWLTEELVREALGHVDPDVGYNTWRDIGFALADFFENKSAAESVFTDWSRGGTKWDDDAEAQAKRIINDSTDGGGRTIATVVHLAKEGGWEIPSAASTGGGESASDEWDEQFDPTESAATTWDDVRNLYGVAQAEDNFNKGKARLAAAQVLENETDWMYVLESERLWVYDSDSGTFDAFGFATAGEVLADELGEFFSQAEKREIIGQIKDRNQVHRKELNAQQHDDPLLCVGDGVVNLRTGEMSDHSPEYRFVRGLEWNFDPDTADRSRVVEFLDDVTEREADRDTLIDHLAHGLMPGHPYRAFVVCYGPGGNGKTQVAELFRGFVGEENSAAVEIDELSGDDFATGDLPEKFLNWGDDMAGDGGGQLKDLSLLKKATGGSEIRANEKFEKTFDFKNEAAMFFSANEPPRIGERKRSIQDRIYPVEMPYTFRSNPDPDDPMQKEKTPNISEELLSDDAAMRGMLALAIEHAQRLIETSGEYSQPESGEERLKKYNRSADPIVKFAGKAVVSAGPDFKIRKDDAYTVYRLFVESWEERSTGERGFKRQFPRAFTDEIETARSRALSTDDDEADRVRCWKRLKWTDSARSKMPEWMEHRYSHHFEDAESEETDTTEPKTQESESSPAFEELGKGFTDVSDVTLAEKLNPPDWLRGKGHLIDTDGNIIPYECEGAEPLSGVEEGETMDIENVKIEDRKAGLTAVLSGVTEVESEGTSAAQSALEDGQAAADGGTTPDAGRDVQKLKKWVSDGTHDGKPSLGRAEVVQLLTERTDRDLDAAKGLLEKALTEGALQEPEEGEIRPV